MEVKGLCSICGLPAKLYTCLLCGKTVCSQCMGCDKRICIRCASGRTGSVPGSEDIGTLK